MLYEDVSSASKTEEKLKFIYGDIKRHINEMHSSAETNRRELSKIYSFVRDLILEREQTLKR
jgi:Mg2+ and Co2+ transporter CorA